MIRMLALPAFLLLGGACAPQSVTPMPPEASCDANRVQDLKGKARTPEIEAEALQRSGAKRVRWIVPGSAVTMDYRPDRLNLHLDDKGRITDGRCG